MQRYELDARESSPTQLGVQLGDCCLIHESSCRDLEQDGRLLYRAEWSRRTTMIAWDPPDSLWTQIDLFPHLPPGHLEKEAKMMDRRHTWYFASLNIECTVSDVHAMVSAEPSE